VESQVSKKPAGDRGAADPNGRTPVRPNARTGRQNDKGGTPRIIVRAGAEIYQDQLDALREFVRQQSEEEHGVSVSGLIRRALDAYIEKRRKS
jgi:hypothetical protein